MEVLCEERAFGLLGARCLGRGAVGAVGWVEGGFGVVHRDLFLGTLVPKWVHRTFREDYPNRTVDFCLSQEGVVAGDRVCLGGALRGV